MSRTHYGKGNAYLNFVLFFKSIILKGNKPAPVNAMGWESRRKSPVVEKDHIQYDLVEEPMVVAVTLVTKQQHLSTLFSPLPLILEPESLLEFLTSAHVQCQGPSVCITK